MAKFVLGLNGRNWDILKADADRREVTVQELLRTIVIPDWLAREKLQDELRQQANKSLPDMEKTTSPC